MACSCYIPTVSILCFPQDDNSCNTATQAHLQLKLHVSCLFVKAAESSTNPGSHVLPECPFNSFI